MSRRSALYEEHQRLGAKLTEFGGWEMPLVYEGTVSEHRAVRTHVGLFDVSHLGKIVVPLELEEALDRAMPGKVAALQDGGAGYNLVLGERGGILDDVFVYRRAEDFLVVPNAANFDTVFEFLTDRVGEVVDARETWSILAVSGPRSREVIAALFGQRADLADLKLHRHITSGLRGSNIMVARTGYTGEVTFELFVPWDETNAVWSEMLSSFDDVVPAGLGARDTLRLEMGYPLHGHDITAETDPIEAGLGWVIDWDKHFPGRQALESVRGAGPARKLVGLLAHDKGIPREGCQVRSGGEPVGEVTSGNFSPTLGKGIALAYLQADRAEKGAKVEVDVRGRVLLMEVVKPPFIES